MTHVYLMSTIRFAERTITQRAMCPNLAIISFDVVNDARHSPVSDSFKGKR